MRERSLRVYYVSRFISLDDSEKGLTKIRITHRSIIGGNKILNLHVRLLTGSAENTKWLPFRDDLTASATTFDESSITHQQRIECQVSIILDMACGYSE